MATKGKSRERGAVAASSAAVLKSPPGIEVEVTEGEGDPVPGKINEKEW